MLHSDMPTAPVHPPQGAELVYDTSTTRGTAVGMVEKLGSEGVHLNGRE
jgi:hypothetical protein